MASCSSARALQQYKTPSMRHCRTGRFVAARASGTVASTHMAPMVDWTDARQLFHHLVNPEESAYNLDAAKAYVAAAHKWTADNILTSSKPEHKLYQKFDYTEPALDERLDFIYRELARESDKYDPTKDPVFSSRDRVLERIRQFAPNNLTDGIWLTGIPRLSGPTSHVKSLLLHILEDEQGNGDPALNHANIYRDLLYGEHMYMPDHTSQEFARSSMLWDEAFELPAYLAATAQFPATCFDETLGITLAFEWTSIALTSMIKLCRAQSPPVNDHFYKLHKGIDNPITGHGAWAVEAVKQHLAETLVRHGAEAQQDDWQRIWLAFVTFQCYGGLDDAFKRQFQAPPINLSGRMVQMVEAKAYASLSHDHAVIDGVRVRDLFQDPEEFVRKLGRSNLVIPGDPDQSRFIKDMSSTGPMFRVFTVKEQKLVRDWIMELGKPADIRRLDSINNLDMQADISILPRLPK